MSFLTRLYPPSLGQPTIPSSIDSTGTFDVSGPLQAFFNSQPDGSTVLGPPGANYLANFGIELFNRFGFTLDAVDPLNPPRLFQNLLTPYTSPEHGTVSQVANLNRNRKVLSFRRGGGHELKNWTIQGGQPDSGLNGDFNQLYEGQHGILIAGVEGMLVEDVFITEVAGDFVYMNNPDIDGIRYTNRDLKIHRCKGRKSSRQGITPVGGINIEIWECDFQDIKRSCIDFEPPGFREIRNVWIHDNDFGFFRNSWIAGAGDGDAIIDGVNIEFNRIHGVPCTVDMHGRLTTSPNTGIHRRSIRVCDNECVGTMMWGKQQIMKFGAIVGVECARNTMPPITGIHPEEGTVNPPPDVGAQFFECCDVTYEATGPNANDWGNAVHDHSVCVDYDVVVVNVGPAGALEDETLVPIDPPLTGQIPDGERIGFFLNPPAGRTLRTNGTQQAGTPTLTVLPLPNDLTDADVGEYAVPIFEYDGEDLEWPGRPGQPDCSEV